MPVYWSAEAGQSPASGRTESTNTQGRFNGSRLRTLELFILPDPQDRSRPRIHSRISKEQYSARFTNLPCGLSAPTDFYLSVLLDTQSFPHIAPTQTFQSGRGSVPLRASDPNYPSTSLRIILSLSKGYNRHYCRKRHVR